MDDIGRQQMVNIQCQDRFIGATCTNNYLYLLTKDWFKILYFSADINLVSFSIMNPTKETIVDC